MTRHANGVETVESYFVFFLLSAVHVCARPVHDHMYSNICSLQYFMCLYKLYVRIILVNGTAEVGSIPPLFTIKHVLLYMKIMKYSNIVYTLFNKYHISLLLFFPKVCRQDKSELNGNIT